MKDLRVALVQEAPVLFDLFGTLEKMDGLLGQAKPEGAEFVLFQRPSFQRIQEVLPLVRLWGVGLKWVVPCGSATTIVH